MKGYRKVLDVASGCEKNLAEGLIKDGIDLDEVCDGGLDMVARIGARMILQAALEVEVDEFLDRKRYERSPGARRGYRNGHRKRGLTCGSGSFQVKVPKVTGADAPFSIRSIPAYQRTSEKILDVLPLLYVEGLSTRDFHRALGSFWKEAGLSRSSVSRANKQLYEEFRAWRKRDLSGVKVLYLFLDGINERVRFGSKEKEGVLVAHCICEDGSRELLGMQLGPRESEEAWLRLLEDLARRGLAEPKLVITDGAPGLIKAVRVTWSQVPRQRCTKHKTANVLDRVPKRQRVRVKRDLVKIFHATGLAEAIRAVDAFLGKYGDEFPTACETLARDIEDCLTFYRFPEAHWKRIRTSNVIERAFREVRRRTRVVGRFPNERSALVLIWASIEHDRLKWRGIRMTPEFLDKANRAREGLIEAPIRVVSARKYLEVA